MRGLRETWAAAVVGALCALGLLAPAVASAHRRPRVLRVGVYHHRRGQFRTIQAAVDRARPGDWILVAPGDYHARGDYRKANRPAPDAGGGGVYITTRRLHLRGLNRNRVIVDGTRPHRGRACSRRKRFQDFGPKGPDGRRLGRNGIEVFEASGVSVENLTVCNFLTGAGSSGNEIWFNGGDGSGKIHLGRFYGGYLNATSTYFGGEDTAAAYGIFSSNSRGPGRWYRTYASNFNDSDYYVGACQRVCNQVLDHVRAQYSALGYSGTNSGGRLVVEHSEFDHNKDGFDTNSQNNDDAPSPQDGACPHNGTSPITHTHSCWVFIHNYVHDNNDPNVPGSGAAAAGPVGTGISISGGRNDTVMDNRIVRNGAWGVILVPYPDTETPPPIAHCEGGVSAPGDVCLFDDWGNALVGNKFAGNGFFGNATNGDIAETTSTPGHPINCYHGNRVPDGTSPPDLQSTNATCGRTALAPDSNPPFVAQVACDSQFFGPCSPGTVASYPRQTKVVMHALPRHLRTMPHPCRGVPANPWCPAPRRRHHRRHGRPSFAG